ncbi:MAG: hypothetical protein JWQ38_2211 [Flavipsychrobacter sp.]|nr:hypothetical protein [Flavipsychrobacter sp.]
MTRSNNREIYFSSILFVFFALVCSLGVHAQSDNHSFLNINTGNPDRENTSVSSPTEVVNRSSCNNTCCKHLYKYFNIDFGTSNLRYQIPTGKRTTHGPGGAISGQIAYKLKTNKDYRQIFISAGIELRNINNVTMVNTPKYGLVYDNLHLVYAGIPIMFQYISTKHTPGAKNDINLYGQAGMSFDYRVYFYEHRRDHTKTWDDKKENFNPLLLQPFASVGISYTTKRHVFLAGPFLAYNVNDISSLSSVEGHFTSYGFRISALMK